jgi:hypothetical protein
MKISMLSRNIFKSVVSNFSRESVTSLGQLLLVPLYISVFTSNDYGIWLLLTSYSSFVVLADFGLSTAVIVKMHKNPPWDSPVNKRLWNEYKLVTRTIAIIICIVVLILVLYYFWTYGHEFHGWGFYLIVTSCFLTLSLQTLQQHNILYQYQLRNSYNQGMKVLFRLRIMELLVTYCALLLKLNIITLLILITSLRQILILVQKKFDFFAKISTQVSYGEHNQSVLKDVWKPAIGNGLLSLSVVLGIHGSFVVAATWASPTSLVTLGLARMLVSPIRLVSGSLAQGSLPHLIGVHENSVIAKKPSNFQLRYSLGYLTVILVTALVVFTTSKFVWAFLSRGSSDFSNSLIWLYMACVVLDAICLMRFQLPMSQNRSLKLGILYLTATCISLIAQPVLANYSQLNAVPISILIGDSLFLAISLIQRSKFR